MNNIRVRQLIYLALLIALSYVGSLIKINGSIALDALPAAFAMVAFGPVAGGITGLCGHLLTAATSGFVYTVPVHIVIALLMGVTFWTGGILYKKTNIVISLLVAFVLNAVVSNFIAVYVMQLMGIIPDAMAMFLMLIGPLALASAVNILLGGVVGQLVKKYIPNPWEIKE
jgi:uncharacterized membrane protein